MFDYSANNKQIVKNTILLYVRLFLTMMVGLYTSRIVLKTLGIDDYGVYNVVAGVVAMFSLMTSSLSAAISRYLTFNLGKGETEKLSCVFASSLNIMIVMAVIILIVGEIVGVWVLNSELNIPADRMDAANWVFHFSVIGFAINLIAVPYNASIIAHERMSVFAYISILEVTLKLIIVFLLYVSPFDKLVTYAVLLMCVTVVVSLVYGAYCRRNFEECHYRLVYEKSLLKEMTGFAGWNFFGSASFLLNTQGVNIITNIFFNVAANAARGVAGQVDFMVRQFATNFTMAINPQITKSYATGDLAYTHSLVCKSSKFSYLLMLFFAVPFMYEAEFIMRIWLSDYPPLAPLFLRLSLVITMIDLLGNSPAIAAWATGNIKRYYMYVGTVVNLMFPLSWVAFYIGMPVFTSYIIGIAIYIMTLIVKLYVIKGLIGFSQNKYISEVIIPIAITTILAVSLPGVIYYLTQRTIQASIIIIAASLIWTCLAIYTRGLSRGERSQITEYVFAKIRR